MYIKLSILQLARSKKQKSDEENTNQEGEKQNMCNALELTPSEQTCEQQDIKETENNNNKPSGEQEDNNETENDQNKDNKQSVQKLDEEPEVKSEVKEDFENRRKRRKVNEELDDVKAAIAVSWTENPFQIKIMAILSFILYGCPIKIGWQSLFISTISFSYGGRGNNISSLK